MMKPDSPSDLPLVIYDCFSDTRFGGNVGGIVLNADALTPEMMQSIASEINAPVTGFVTAQKGRDVTARFFMPSAEIAMCGHVTVGLFSHLSQEGGFGDGDFTMQTQAGEVKVLVTANHDAPPTVLMQVGLPELKSPEIDTSALAGALDVAEVEIGKVTPLEFAEAGLSHLFVHLEELETVQKLTPDFRKLADVSSACGVHTVACFSMQTEDPANTLHIRDFCPAVGADEVPASGTTNGALAGYLVRHALVPPGPQSVRAEQGAEMGRPSLVRCEIDSLNRALINVHVGGQAVASIKGIVSGS